MTYLSRLAGKLSPGARLAARDRRGAAARHEMTQIDLARCICIFMMIGVHVYPGVRETTLFYNGPLHGFWLVYMDFLGRASVAVLSFFSGYILYQQAARKSVWNIAEQRFRTVYMPMVTWSAVKILMVLVLVLVEGGSFADWLEREGLNSLKGWANDLFALTDQPANLPLGFLRDLFVSIVLVRLLVPALPWLWPVVLAVTLVLTLFRLTEPVVLRPSILLFVLAGACFALSGRPLRALSRPKVAIPAAGLLLTVFLAATLMPPDTPILAEEIPNIAKRATLVFAILLVTDQIVRRAKLPELAPVRQLLFLIFLTHGLVSQALGELWERTGIANTSGYYALFYVVSIAIFICVGLILNRLVDYLPARLQVAIAGRARG
ncbi:MAG: acyltransferase [Pseudomonadota bacterium]